MSTLLIPQLWASRLCPREALEGLTLAAGLLVQSEAEDQTQGTREPSVLAGLLKAQEQAIVMRELALVSSQCCGWQSLRSIMGWHSASLNSSTPICKMDTILTLQTVWEGADDTTKVIGPSTW